MNLNEVICDMKPRDRVRVTFESGAYFDGTVKNLKKQLTPQLTAEIRDIKITYVPIRFRSELCKKAFVELGNSKMMK